MNKVRVRYAPSPTGYLHIGGARSALFNYLYAKKYNGDFVFRIEDTDIERNVEGAEESQYNDLIWLGIIPDESPFKVNPKYAPYRQTEKLDIYKKYCDILISKGLAYYCYETPEELEALKEEQLSNGVKSFKYLREYANYSNEDLLKFKKENRTPSVRIKMEENIDLSFNDLIRGKINFSSDDIGDFVILKSNGIPTYNFAVVIDDHMMEITHVFRGEEHLSNTPKQLQIYKYFNWEAPKFGHMTIIINENGKKLSKRDNNILQFISEYKKLGFLPEAIFNFLLLLGYNPDIKIENSEKNKEIFNKKEAIESFDESKLSKAPSMFDNKKLLWINNQYILNMNDDDYLEYINSFINQTLIKDYDYNKKNTISLMYKKEISFGNQIIDMINSIIKPEYNLSDEEIDFLNLDTSKTVINEFKNKLLILSEFNSESVKDIINQIKNEYNIKGKNLFMPLRLKLTGVTHGIELFNIMYILGKVEVIKRLSV